MKPTEKQLEYARDIAEELGIDLPDEEEDIPEFIDENVSDFYHSRRERMGGYGEMMDRLDRKPLD